MDRESQSSLFGDKTTGEPHSVCARIIMIFASMFLISDHST